jgi:hypothetical protein
MSVTPLSHQVGGFVARTVSSPLSAEATLNVWARAAGAHIDISVSVDVNATTVVLGMSADLWLGRGTAQYVRSASHFGRVSEGGRMGVVSSSSTRSADFDAPLRTLWHTLARSKKWREHVRPLR